jgi:phosphate butyryltransferase
MTSFLYRRSLREIHEEFDGQISIRACYDWLFPGCPEAQKLVLVQLAQEKLINPNSRSVVRDASDLRRQFAKEAGDRGPNADHPSRQTQEGSCDLAHSKVLSTRVSMLFTMVRAASHDQRELKDFSDLRLRAQALGPQRVGVVAAEDENALTAVDAAVELGIAIPVLIGNERKTHMMADALELSALIAKAEFVDTDDTPIAAAQMGRDHRVDLLLKGHLRTDQLFRAVLDHEAGLRTERLLSDVLLYEDRLGGFLRLVGITDGGLNVSPNLEQKKQIVQNAVEVMHSLGVQRPKIAIMSATEAVSDSVPSTVDAKALTEMAEAGQFEDAEVFGPLALDCALLTSAAEAKGIAHRVAGHADCMVVPNLEAGNLLGKAVKYLGGSQCAHVVAGAKIPILIPSRVESAEDKLNSIALGVVFAAQTISHSRH